MSLIKKILLDMQHQIMACSSEWVKSLFNPRCDMREALCVQCVHASVPKRDMLIWLADMNFHSRVSRTPSVTINEFWSIFF